MRKPTEWEDRLEVQEDGLLYRVVRAVYRKKGRHIALDVYKESSAGEAWSQNLFTCSWGGYVVAFPGLEWCRNRNSWWYSEETVEDELGWGECDRRLNVGGSTPVTAAELETVLALFPEFRYTVRKFPAALSSAKRLMDILLMWIRHPELEMVLAAGYEKVGMNGSFWRMTEANRREICRFMRAHPEFGGMSLGDIRGAIRCGDAQLWADYLNDVPCWRRRIGRGEFRTEDVITIDDYRYLLRERHTDMEPGRKADYYFDYLRMLHQTHHDCGDEYWRHPRNLTEAHGRILDEINREEDERRRRETAESRRVMRSVVRKLSWKNTEIDGFRIFVTGSFGEWKRQADTLHQCILASGYMDGMARRQYLIVFIRDADGNPLATAQIFPDGSVGQFYTDERDRDSCLPTEEMRTALRKWLELKKPRKVRKTEFTEAE